MWAPFFPRGGQVDSFMDVAGLDTPFRCGHHVMILSRMQVRQRVPSLLHAVTGAINNLMITKTVGETVRCARCSS